MIKSINSLVKIVSCYFCAVVHAATANPQKLICLIRKYGQWMLTNKKHTINNQKKEIWSSFNDIGCSFLCLFFFNPKKGKTSSTSKMNRLVLMISCLRFFLFRWFLFCFSYRVAVCFSTMLPLSTFVSYFPNKNCTVVAVFFGHIKKYAHNWSRVRVCISIMTFAIHFNNYTSLKWKQK